MKTKVLLLFGLLALALVSFGAATLNEKETPYLFLYAMEDTPTGDEKIEMMGSLMLSVGPNDIVAGASDDAVQIHFNQSFGNVNVSLYNSNGYLVYNNMVDTSIQHTVVISIANAASGTYTLVLNNATDYAEGDFDHK